MKYLTLILLAAGIMISPLFFAHGSDAGPSLSSKSRILMPDTSGGVSPTAKAGVQKAVTGLSNGLEIIHVTASAKNGAVLTTIEITPDPSTIEVGQSVIFTAQGKDQNNNSITIPNPAWYSDGVHGTLVVDPTDPNKCTYIAAAEGADYVQCCQSHADCGLHGSKDFTVVAAGQPVSTTYISIDSEDKGADNADPVSMNNGAFHFRLPLLNLGGPLPLAYSVSYSTAQERTASAGLLNNFRHNMNFTVTWFQENGADIVSLILGDGETAGFKKVGDLWQLHEASPVRYTLTESGPDHTNGYYYFMNPASQRVYIFEKNVMNDGQFFDGRLLYILDRNGNRHDFTYTEAASRTIQRIEDNLGRRLDFDYSIGNVLETVTDQSGRFIRFILEDNAPDYNNWTVLRSIVNAAGGSRTFRYSFFPADAWGAIREVKYPEGNIPYTQTLAGILLNGETWYRVTNQTDAYSNTTTFTYAPGENRVTLTQPDGNTIDYKHHHNEGLPSAITDAAGNEISFGQSANEQPTAVTLDSGPAADRTYHPESGLLSAFTDPDGNTVSGTYTAVVQPFINPADGSAFNLTFFDLTRRDYPDGTFETMAYDGQGNLLTFLNRVGKTTTFTYNTQGRMLTKTLPSGGTVTSTYNPDGTKAASQTPETGTTTFGYDALKRLNRVTRDDGTFRTWAYDPNDRITAVTDERGNTVTLAYDANGNLTTITDPKGRQISFAYDLLDRVVSKTDRLGQTTTFIYNATGRLASKTDPNLVQTGYGYEPRGMPDSITRAGQTWQQQYGNAGVLVGSITPLGFTTETERNNSGLTVAVTDPEGGRTQFTRDTLHRVTNIVDPTGRTLAFDYNAWDSLEGLTNAVLGAAVYTRDDIGALTRITDFNGQVWQSVRSPFGRPLSSIDPLNNTTAHTYDALGRLLTTTFADGETVTRQRDTAGNITKLTYGSGLNRSFVYDPDINRLAAADGIALDYNQNGRITATTNADGSIFTAAFDAGGRMAGTTCAGLFNVTYTYNAGTGLLERISDSLTATQIDFSYDNDRRLAKIERSNGIDTSVTHDQAGRITRIEHGAFADLQYAYDAVGRITGQTLDAPLLPDSALSSGMDTLAFDAAGQVSSPGYAYNQRGQRTADPDHTYAWDAAARLAGIDGTITFAYNALNDLISRTEGGNTITLAYNRALGMNPIVAERNGAAGPWKRFYVHTPGGVLLYAIDALNGNAVSNYHFDAQGNTLAMTGPAGTVTDAYAYSPYGSILSHTGSSDQPFTFTGQWGVRQEGTGGILYHMRARYYDASAGAFLSRDPVGPRLSDPHALNPYEYAKRNPLSYVDPMGTCALGIITVAFNEYLKEAQEEAGVVNWAALRLAFKLNTADSNGMQSDAERYAPFMDVVFEPLQDIGSVAFTDDSTENTGYNIQAGVMYSENSSRDRYVVNFIFEKSTTEKSGSNGVQSDAERYAPFTRLDLTATGIKRQ